MNVAILCFDYSRNGGSEKVAGNLYQAISVKYPTHLISLFSENSMNCNEEGNVSPHIISKNKGVFIISFLTVLCNLSKYCKGNKIDVIISVGINCSLYACLLKLFVNARVIICEHSNIANIMYNSWRQHIKRRFAVVYADKLITLTEADAETYKSKYPKRKGKIRTIYNWIGDNWLNQITKYDCNSKKILTVCRLDRVKGLERGVDVVSRIFKKNSDWVWHIYGTGDEEYKKELIEKATKLGIAKNVVFCGQATENELMTKYPLYSIYLCTSHFEGMPMSLLEAKANKIPIVSFNCQTGPAEIIENNINGLLVKQGDVNELYKLLKELIEDKNLRQSLSDKSYSNIYKFKKETIVKQWVSLIDNND
jgi:glycosyltransferase involved in cell wall biosynthesis